MINVLVISWTMSLGYVTIFQWWPVSLSFNSWKPLFHWCPRHMYEYSYLKKLIVTVWWHQGLHSIGTIFLIDTNKMTLQTQSLAEVGIHQQDILSIQRKIPIANFAVVNRLIFNLIYSQNASDISAQIDRVRWRSGGHQSAGLALGQGRWSS